MKLEMHVCVFFIDDIIKWKHFPRYWPFVWEIFHFRIKKYLIYNWITWQKQTNVCGYTGTKLNDVNISTPLFRIIVTWIHFEEKPQFLNSYDPSDEKALYSLGIFSPNLKTPYHMAPLLLTWFNLNPSMDK